MPIIFAFADCALKSVVLPDSIESIGRSAFANAPLEYINIPNSVKSIGWGTFVTKVLKYVTFEGTDVDIAPFTFICLPEIFNLPATTDPEIAKNIGTFIGVKFYDSDKTTEITPDGRWGAFEIKLGASKIEEGAENLKKIDELIRNDPKGRPPEFLAVICGLSSAAYMRDDGVYVIPITSLGP